MNFEVVRAAFIDELNNISQDKIAKELTPEGRAHVAGKNFAVSAKASNTGKPAYPIPDKAHARAALGFAAMHHDKKDLAEVRKDVAKKFPGMVHDKEKEAAEGVHPKLEKAYQDYDKTMTPAHRLREGLSMLGGGVTGAGLGAGAGYGIGHIAKQLGLNINPETAAVALGVGLGGLGLLTGGIVGGSHGASDVALGKAHERVFGAEGKYASPNWTAFRETAQELLEGKA